MIRRKTYVEYVPFTTTRTRFPTSCTRNVAPISAISSTISSSISHFDVSSSPPGEEAEATGVPHQSSNFLILPQNSKNWIPTIKLSEPVIKTNNDICIVECNYEEDPQSSQPSTRSTSPPSLPLLSTAPPLTKHLQKSLHSNISNTRIHTLLSYPLSPHRFFLVIPIEKGPEEEQHEPTPPPIHNPSARIPKALPTAPPRTKHLQKKLHPPTFNINTPPLDSASVPPHRCSSVPQPILEVEEKADSDESSEEMTCSSFAPLPIAPPRFKRYLQKLIKPDLLANNSALSQAIISSQALRKISPKPNHRPHADEKKRVLQWIKQWAHEEQRHQRIDTSAIIAARKKMELIHDNKKKLIGIWDPRTTHRYRQAAQKFYIAAGISREEQQLARKHWAKSGLWYAGTQAVIFPTRLMNVALGLPAFQSDAAAYPWMLARASLHASIGGILSPMWDTLAALSKRGMPAPAAIYWDSDSRRHVINQLTQCMRQTEQILSLCKKQACSIPSEITALLEETYHHYKMINAKSFCYLSASAVSGVFEFAKTSVDILMAALTTPMTVPIERAATNACSAAVYALTSPLEETAAMDQILTQNAKYADISKEGQPDEVDLKKVMNLWQGPRQVEMSYIEKAVGRRLAKYLHKLNHNDSRIRFLENIKTLPNQESHHLYTELTICQAKIAHIKSRLDLIKPTIHKNRQGDISLLTQLEKSSKPNRDLIKKIRHAPATGGNLFPSLRGARTKMDRIRAQQQEDASLKLESSSKKERQLITELVNKIKHVSTGKGLVSALKYELRALEQQQREIKLQIKIVSTKNTASRSTDTPLEDLHHERMEAINKHTEEKKKYIGKLLHLSADYQLFKALQKEYLDNSNNDLLKLALRNLDRNGLITKMLLSRRKLYWEAIKAAYAPPGAILVRTFVERMPLFAVIATLLSLGVPRATAQGPEKTTSYLHWLESNPPALGSVPQPTLLAEYVGTVFFAGAIQELTRVQAQRSHNMKYYLQQHHNLPAFVESTLSKHIRKTIPQINEDYLQYTPEFDGLKTILQELNLTRPHPESEHLYWEHCKSQSLAIMKTLFVGYKESLSRPFVDIGGLYIKYQTKKTLEKITEHNARQKDVSLNTPPQIAEPSTKIMIDDVIKLAETLGAWNDEAGDIMINWLLSRPDLTNGRRLRIINNLADLAKVDVLEYEGIKPPIYLFYSGQHYTPISIANDTPQIIDTPADGDCFFRALISVITGNLTPAEVPKKAIREIRASVAQAIGKNREEIQEFLFDRARAA